MFHTLLQLAAATRAQQRACVGKQAGAGKHGIGGGHSAWGRDAAGCCNTARHPWAPAIGSLPFIESSAISMRGKANAAPNLTSAPSIFPDAYRRSMPRYTARAASFVVPFTLSLQFCIQNLPFFVHNMRPAPPG